MIHKLFRLKNDLFYNANASIEEAEELHDKDKFAAAEYFLGKAAAYSCAGELIETILREELPCEED